MNLKNSLLWAMICLLSGCAISPPEPPQPEGEFRPVNVQPCPARQDAEPEIQEELLP